MTGRQKERLCYTLQQVLSKSWVKFHLWEVIVKGCQFDMLQVLIAASQGCLHLPGLEAEGSPPSICISAGPGMGQCLAQLTAYFINTLVIACTIYAAAE